jgi:hypothetical protein
MRLHHCDRGRPCCHPGRARCCLGVGAAGCQSCPAVGAAAGRRGHASLCPGLHAPAVRLHQNRECAAAAAAGTAAGGDAGTAAGGRTAQVAGAEAAWRLPQSMEPLQGAPGHAAAAAAAAALQPWPCCASTAGAGCCRCLRLRSRRPRRPAAGPSLAGVWAAWGWGFLHLGTAR